MSKSKIKLPSKREDARIRRGIEFDVDIPEITDADWKHARPASEVVPHIVKAYREGTLRYRGQRGPQKKPKKISVHARLSPEVVAFFKAKGPGWQTRMDNVLMALVEAAG